MNHKEITRLRFFLKLWVIIYAAVVITDVYSNETTQKPLTKEKKPVLLRAEDITYENELGIIVARGSVQIADDQNFVEADTVTYNQKLNTVTATGNVRLFSKEGDIIRGEYIELSDDFKDGFIEKVYILTSDNSRFAGEKAVKKDFITVLDKGVYSPCDLCTVDPHAPPTWQIKAHDIIRDELAGDIYYSHATMEFLGLPVFYMPHLMHADPSIKRRSGVMFPFIGSGTNFGFGFGLPYYMNISPDKEAVIQPIGTTDGGVFLKGEYRQRFRNGIIEVKGSGAYTDNKDKNTVGRSRFPKQYFGHLFSNGYFNLTNIWRFKYDLRKIGGEGRSYLKRYPFLELETVTPGVQNMLTSQMELEGFYGKSYASAKGYWFQDLRENALYHQTPLVFPILAYTYVGDPTERGDFWSFDISSMYLTRKESALEDARGGYAKPGQVERVSSKVMWTLPYTSSGGSVYQVRTSMRMDFYDVRNYQSIKTGPKYDGGYGRIIPQAAVYWRKPLIGDFMEKNLVIEPISSLIVGANGGNPKYIPNEDSQDFELDMNNLFLEDRFPGLDRVDLGQRWNYGINLNLYNVSDSKAQLFLGQSYSFTDFKAYPNAKTKGIYKGFSDYVGRTTFSPTPDYSLSYSFQLARRNLRHKRSQVSMAAGPPIFKVGASYFYASKEYFKGEGQMGRHQVLGTLSSKFHENWQVNTSLAYDLGPKKGILSNTIELGYLNECFGLKFLVVRSYFKDRDIRPGNTYFLTFSFKNLGEYKTSGVTEGDPMEDVTKYQHGLKPF
jgi:LPS-assembly protein